MRAGTDTTGRSTRSTSAEGVGSKSQKAAPLPGEVFRSGSCLPPEERVKATYRDNFERLVAVKNEYDPTNLFRVNQNIRPTATV